MKSITTALALLSVVFVSTAFAEKPRMLETAIFAGGCFWCMEKPFDDLEGVHATISGYIGGHQDNPTYHQVSAGKTGHTEAVQITYDPQLISYQQLLAVFWPNIDPFNAKGQFCDYGSQYRPGIFYTSQEQLQAASASLEKVQARFKDDKVVAEITKASTFYPAEDYHQDYYLKNPVRYKYYRYSCGRDKRLEKIWGKTTK